MDKDAFDDYVAVRIPGHVAAIKARIVLGDPATVNDIDTSLGNELFSSEQWADMIQKTAMGENAFAVIMDKAIHDAAEILAIKDAEQAERDAQAANDELRIAQHEADRGMV